VRSRARSLALLVAAASLAASAPCRADDAKDAKKDAVPSVASSDEASRRFKSGVSFYKDNDFAAAMVEFKHAYELLPNFAVLYNIGRTARELKDYAAALAAFEQYLGDGGTKVSPARRKEITAAIDELRHKVGKIKIAASADGAEISVDDRSVGQSPLPASIVANVGQHKVSASLTGHTPAQRMVDVASMEEAAVTLDLPKIEASVPRDDGTPPPPPPKRPIPLYAWITAGATGAIGLSAGVTGLVALSAHSSLKTALGTYPGNAATIASDQTKTKNLAVATDVLGALTVGGGVATALVFLLPRRTAESPPPAVGVGVGVGPASVFVRGAF
jgi:hypothetical protein